MLAKITDAPKLKNPNIRQLSLLLAGLYTIYAVTQLFSFEDFVLLTKSFDLFGSAILSTVLASLIVIGEVFSLPYLLRIRVSRLMRVFSMVCSWFVAIIWLIISLWLVSTINAVPSLGLFGGLLDVEPGWWSVFFSLSLVILNIWIAWGMWPLSKKRSKRVA